MKKYQDFMADENNEDYKDGLSAIEKAITDIGKATSEDKVKELLDNAIEGVSAETKKAMEDFEKAKTDALVDLQKYVDALSKVEGLTEADKTRVKSLVNEASAKVKAANSETAITEEVGDFEKILESGFKNVALRKAVDSAVKELEAYKDSSKPGMNTYIDEQIEDIKDMLKDPTKKMSDVETALDTAKEIADPLKKAQEDAYATIQEYRDYVAKDTSLDSTKKDLINGELDTVLKSINDADADTEVTSALEGLDTFMDTYADVKSGVALENAKKELATKYQEYLVELAPYLSSSSEDVKSIAENAKASMKKIAEPEEVFTTAAEVQAAQDKLIELYETGKDSKNQPTAPGDSEFYKLSDLKDKDIVEETGAVMENFVGYKAILEHNDTLAKKNDKEDKEKLAETLKNAEETLALYEKVLNDVAATTELELSSEDISNIQKWIDSTRTTVEAAKGASEVTAAMTLLNGSSDSFLATYYPNYKEYADNYDLSHAKTEVSAKLKELKEQYKDADDRFYSDLKREIDTFIGEMDTYTTATEVRAKLTKVNKDIEIAGKQAELALAKQDAIDKLNDALLKVKDAEGAEAVKSKIGTLQDEITALKYDGVDNFNTPADVEKKVKAADKEIQDLLKKVEEDRVEALNRAKTPILTTIDNYIEIANAIADNPVAKQLSRYRSAVSSAATQTDLDKIYANADKTLEEGWTSEFYIYIKNQCPVLDAQYDTIFGDSGLKKTYENIKDAEKVALINKAIEDIKLIKANSADEATTEINKIKTKLAKDLGDIDTANTEITNYKTEAIQAIEDEIDKFISDATFKNQLESAVQGYKDKINAVTRNDSNWKTIIDTNKKNALDIINTKVAQKIIATVETTDVVKKEELETVQDQLLGKEVVDFAEEGTLTCEAVSGKADTYKVSGELKKISNFTEFGNGDDAEGNYLPLVIKNDFAQKITCELAGEGTKHPGIEIELKDGDNVFIAQINNEKTQKIIVRYYSNANDETPAKTITYELDGLTLATE